MDILPENINKLLRLIDDNSAVVVDDRNAFAKKLGDISKGGKQNLCVITDYDASLTTYWLEPGKRSLGVYSVPMATDLVSDRFKFELKQLYKDYLPDAAAKEIRTEDREAKMLGACKAANQLFIQEGFSLDLVDKIIAQYDTKFRDSVDEFFAITQKLQVPVVIFSAGLTDLIEATLKKYQFYNDNVKVLSNKMHFAKKPPYQATKFGPVIQVFNKHKLSLKEHQGVHHCIGKPNGIIIGDAIDDSGMGDAFKLGTKLKIGILNHGPTNQLLPIYLKHFDMVLLGNPDFKLVNQIVALVS